MDKSQAFRDDLAAQRVAIFGYDPAAPGSDMTSHVQVSALESGKSRIVEQRWRRGGFGRMWLDELAAGPAAPAVPFDFGACFKRGIAKACQAQVSLSGSEPWRFTTSDGMAWINHERAPGTTYLQWASECQAAADAVQENALRFFDEAAPITESMFDGILRRPAIPASHIVDIRVNITPAGVSIQDFVVNDLLAGGCGLPSDLAGIAAMAAKNVKPASEPALSIAGEKGTAAEFAEALQAIRAKNSPPAQETPRGLLCMPEAFDHRLGAWGR